jgi:hypothetical protein
MFSRKAAFPSTRRATAIAVAAALALTAVVPSVASAASAGKGFTASSGMTDISARRRGFNPGAAAVAGVVGLGIAAAAAANSRGYYDDSYAYYGDPGPVYVAPGPGYYYGGYGGYGRYGGVPADQNGHPNASW